MSLGKARQKRVDDILRRKIIQLHEAGLSASKIAKEIDPKNKPIKHVMNILRQEYPEQTLPPMRNRHAVQ